MPTETEDVVDVVDTPADTETVETSDRPSFQEAFERARDQHSAAAAEHAPAADASTEDDAETKAPAKGTRTPTTTPTDPTALLTDAEFDALQTKYATDPLKLRKALEGAFTKKTQALADQRRSAERFAPYVEIIDALEADAPATIRALAKQYGLQIATPDETRPDPATEAATTTAVDQVVTEFKEALGPELDYLADGLAPAIMKLVDRLTEVNVTKATKPLRDQTESLTTRAALEATDVTMKAFGERHPDWKDHEAAMFGLSQQLQPKGMTEADYLDTLYALVTRENATEREATIERRATDKAKATIAKMTKGAAGAETPGRATPEGQVRNRVPERPTFHEAFEAAKRGEVWQ